MIRVIATAATVALLCGTLPRAQPVLSEWQRVEGPVLSEWQRVEGPVLSESQRVEGPVLSESQRVEGPVLSESQRVEGPVLSESQRVEGLNTQLVMLGTGTPNADPERYGPAVAVVVGDASYLVDFGVGVVRRAAAAEQKGIRALGATRLSRAFATHLHSDHTLGFADLIFTPWVLERETPLEVYGPRGLKAMANHLVEAYAEDIRIRSAGGEPAHKYDPRIVNVHEIAAGPVYHDERVTVTAFPVSHGAAQAFGYRFQTADRSIVISGDTGADSRIEDHCRGCDVLVHEVYSEAGLPSRPPAWQAYHKRYHTSSRQLGAIAARAKPGLLVLYHQLMWTSNEEELLKEVRSVYDGKVVSAHDLDVY